MSVGGGAAVLRAGGLGVCVVARLQHARRLAGKVAIQEVVSAIGDGRLVPREWRRFRRRAAQCKVIEPEKIKLESLCFNSLAHKMCV